MNAILTRARRSLERLVWRWGRWGRAWMAYRHPMRFASWVNSERAGITIWNDPSGRWNVQIGSLVPASTGRTLGEAMCHQCLTLDGNEEWRWTFETLRSPNAQGSPTAPGTTKGHAHE